MKKFSKILLLICTGLLALYLVVYLVAMVILGFPDKAPIGYNIPIVVILAGYTVGGTLFFIAERKIIINEIKSIINS